MTLKTLLLSCFSVLFLISCTQGSGKKEDISGEEREVGEVVRSDKVAEISGDEEEEEFDLFIQHFSKDKTF